MPNQRVVVPTDDECEAILQSLYMSPSRLSAMHKLRAALEHPQGGITDDMVGNLLNELRGFDAGDEQDWIDARRALEAALFPGEDNE